jgi:hypothetical protein
MVVLCLGLSLLAVGCGDPKQANKDNFAKAISQSLQKNPGELANHGFGGSQSCFIHLGNQFPQKLTQSSKFARPGRNILPTIARLDILAQQGLLTSSTIKEEESKFDGRVVTKSYDVTDKGKPKVIQSKDGKQLYLPYCKLAFKEVTSYTEPAEGMGAKYSQVNFTYTIENVDDWAKDPANYEQFPEAKGATAIVGQPIEGKMILILTNEGWRNSKDLSL